MASLELNEKTRRYRVRFRYAGRPFKRSLKTTDRREALDVLGRINDTIRLLEQGRLEMPSDANPGVFILSDGKHASKACAPKVRTLAQLFQAYRDGLPAGAKEQSTLTAEERHMKHLRRLLRANTEVQFITLNKMQEVVRKRSQEKWRGKHIDPETIKKEIATFRYTWNWGVSQGFLTGPAPVKGILLPKCEEKLPFRTWEEITAIIDANVIPANKQKTLWDCLFLRSVEIEQLLDFVQSTARHQFIYPLFTFLAHTGCRRSELARAELADFDFKSRTVMLREKRKATTSH
jgi:integrase